MKRFLWIGFVLFLELICIGCGDTFRPIIVPNPPVFPNPAAAHTVVSINDNGTAVVGSAMVVDVSGDSDVSVVNVGLAPVHAVQQSARVVLVANQSVNGATADSLTKLTFNSTVISSANTISLPVNSAPNFVATTESTQAYVLLPNLTSVGVVDTETGVMTASMAVGNDPVAMAETANSQKLYVANRGDNTISGFNTFDRSSRTVNGSFNAPLWVLARGDSQRLYVLNSNGVVSTIDTTSSAGPDNVIDASITVPKAVFMLYDGNLNRLYIPGGSQLTILDVSQSIPSPLGASPITIPTVPPSSRDPLDPCAATSAAPLTVVGVAALPDGSRAYVGSFYEDAADNFCPQVTVIDVASNTIKTYFPVPGVAAYDAFCSPAQSTRAPRFRLMMAAGGDSTRAYLASCDGGAVDIIDTSTDTYELNLPEPLSARMPIPPDPQNPPQNPVFLIAGP